MILVVVVIIMMMVISMDGANFIQQRFKLKRHKSVSFLKRIIILIVVIIDQMVDGCGRDFIILIMRGRRIGDIQIRRSLFSLCLIRDLYFVKALEIIITARRRLLVFCF